MSGLGTESTDLSAPAHRSDIALSGSRPLRSSKHERYCWLRAQMRPKANAYRGAGFSSMSDHDAGANGSRLERRSDVADRIAYLCRQEEELLQAKRARIEELLWMIHESNVADLWETYEDEKRDKSGNRVLVNGEPVIVKKQRPKLLSDLPNDVQRVVESCGIDEHGRVIPKAYSKMQANQELRKLLNIGTVQREEGELSRMSDDQLIGELKRQANELGINIDLNYRIGP